MIPLPWTRNGDIGVIEVLSATWTHEAVQVSWGWLLLEFFLQLCPQEYVSLHDLKRDSIKMKKFTQSSVFWLT